MSRGTDDDTTDIGVAGGTIVVMQFTVSAEAEILEAAARMAAQGAFERRPHHNFDAGGPMTDMTTINLPLMAVEHHSFGNRAYCTFYIDAIATQHVEMDVQVHRAAKALDPCESSSVGRGSCLAGFLVTYSTFSFVYELRYTQPF